MHLKRLEAFGFKSFADKVTLEFEPGFICIVGPNGCGKSNVVDSVKWVLGERSAKSLRGTEMLDVIFNGSAHRKPLNFAEVTLTFDNPAGENGVRALRLDAPEVSVTRRLYRSGESEYLLNKALCRLTDIKELFFDTGIGTSSYSIIEQGRISQMLEANSKERRDLFEEAAGIHKYKERKKLALRKLERVEQNLARVGDTVNELESRLRSVTRQATKARKAKEITDRLRSIKLDLLLYEVFHAKSNLGEVEGRLHGAQQQAAALSAELGEAQAGTVTAQETMARLDGEVSKAHHELSEAKAAFAGLEEAIKSEQRSIEEMREEAARAKQAAVEAGNRAAALASERERLELDLANGRQTLEERKAGVEHGTVALAEQVEQQQAASRDLEAARAAGLDALGRRTQAQQALAQAEADISGIDYRLRKAQASVDKAEGQLRFAQNEAEEVTGRLEQIRRRREMLETEQSGMRTLLARTEDEIKRTADRAQEIANQVEQGRSRCSVLEDLIARGEGLAPGVRAVLTTLRNAGELGEDFVELVANCLGVHETLEPAMEAALGAELESLVVGKAETAERLMDRLQAEGLGRATFLPLDRLGTGLFGSAMTRGLDTMARFAPGCLGRAAELVKPMDEVYRDVAEALLGEVLVFETTVEARKAHYDDVPSSRWRRVSLEGAIFEPIGAIGGGKHKVNRLGLIGRRNEIDRLRKEIDEREQARNALTERIAFLEKRAQQVSRDEERLAQNVAALGTSANELKGVLAAIAREEARSTEEKQVADDEIRELESERRSHVERIDALRADVEEIKRQEAEIARSAEAQSAELARRDEAVHAGRQHLEDMKREASTLTVRVEGLEREVQALSEQFADRRDVADRELAREASLNQRREHTEASLAEKQAARTATVERIGACEAKARGLVEEKENARLYFEDARGRERAVGQQLEEVRGQISEVERRQVELRLRLDGKLEETRRVYEVDALQALAERGGPPEVSDEIKAEAEKLEDRLQRLGPVNMYALEEQRELEERQAFFKTQADDLSSARSKIREVVSKLNRLSRQKFQDTFVAVRANFQEIFRKLFGGGKADLILEEGEDILEAGIEVVARPPGKEPRSIMQLSGGEKAMTTIALLFAVFRSRPAPFCILDEVDAPLDEANVDRFNMMLREFMDRSQFVVITHNKKTMSYGDVLYGITMPEPGVSKRIAIRFDDIEKHLPMDEIDRQAKQARTEALAQVDAIGSRQVTDAEPERVAADGADATVESEAQISAGGADGD